ncbi:MAG: alpha-glucosidase, partial [Pseudomonadales bacterium]|nr:alpha-glucosidase [Pseudomonadales bacterium]
MTSRTEWWKQAVAYQVYVKSFFDSDGDGLGDLPGLISKLDYLRYLGVDLLWLTPVQLSPYRENGYDISDYQAIQPELGTLDDFGNLLKEAHARDIRIITDFVINHTSDLHPWFIESRSSRTNPRRDYYIWRDGKDGCEPNNWASHFSEAAWTFDEQTEQYYLHLFSKHQPDLNWNNPAVRDELQRMMKWWLDRGIDGFRLDAINLISKRQDFPDNSVNDRFFLSQQGSRMFSLDNFRNGPDLNDFLVELKTRVMDQYDCVTVGECAMLNVDDAVGFSAPATGSLDMTFLFEHTEHYNLVGKDPEKLKEIITRWQTDLHGRGWVGIAFNNHDQPRVVSCFGNDADYRKESAKLFAVLLLSLEGTPFIYQGEEIGMTSVTYDDIADYDDVATINEYAQKISDGIDPDIALDQVRAISRDRGRSPFQWNAEKAAGFTTGKPWIGINQNYAEVNLQRDLEDTDSVCHFYKKMIALRKLTPALVHGSFTRLDSPQELYVFERTFRDETVTVVLNPGDVAVSYTCDVQPKLSNYPTTDHGLVRPWEARILKSAR